MCVVGQIIGWQMGRRGVEDGQGRVGSRLLVALTSHLLCARGRRVGRAFCLSVRSSRRAKAQTGATRGGEGHCDVSCPNLASPLSPRPITAGGGGRGMQSQLTVSGLRKDCVWDDFSAW